MNILIRTKKIIFKPFKLALLKFLNISLSDFIVMKDQNKLSNLISKGTESSFAGERNSLEEIIEDLAFGKGFVVDIAASDGFTQSSTVGLFQRANWGGLAVEMDPVKFSKLAFLYRNFTNTKLANTRVTPFNASELLNAFEVDKDFEVLNLDIDSYDLAVLHSLFISGFLPKVITAEINEKIPSGVYFTVDFDDKHYWKGDHFFGCSIDALSQLANDFGYCLIKVEYNNALFVRNDQMTDKYLNLSAQEAYEKGYKNKENRRELFPWNSDVDYWLDLSPEELLPEIQRHFADYEGKYTLRIS